MSGQGFALTQNLSGSGREEDDFTTLVTWKTGEAHEAVASPLSQAANGGEGVGCGLPQRSAVPGTGCRWQARTIGISSNICIL